MSCSTPEKALLVKPTKVSKFALLAAITCSGVKVISNLQNIKKDGQTALNPARWLKLCCSAA
jgi:hypothetical protein